MNILLSFCFVAVCTLQTISCDDILVEVQQGSLRGKLVEAVCTDFDFYSFEAIPYAKAPVGELRFKAPEDAVSWEGVRDATALGPMCPQYNSLSKLYTPGSEDCLTLNVYSRNLTGNVPVVVYLSGFAYEFDGDEADLLGPDFLVKYNVVSVTINCRKGPLGFLNLGTTDVSGNAALKDQVKALKWVQDNIKAFGGNPDSVTLAGMSSGSAAVAHHMMSPMSSNLFHKAIMISGVPTCDPIYSHKVKEYSYLLSQLTGLNSEDGSEVLAHLQSLPYEQLILKAETILPSEAITNQLFKKMAAFVPVVEQNLGQERFITEDLMTAMSSGLVNKVPVVIGYCDQEALLVVDDYVQNQIELYNTVDEMYAPNKILYNSSPRTIARVVAMIKEHYFENKPVCKENLKQLVKCNSLSCMVYDSLKYAKKLSLLTDVYFFKFGTTSARNLFGLAGAKYGIEGAAHADPLYYLFSPKSMYLALEDHEKIKQFVSSLTSFAIHGNPRPDTNVAWPLFTASTQYYLEFTDTTTVKQGPDSEDVEFWDQVYEVANFSLYP